MFLKEADKNSARRSYTAVGLLISLILVAALVGCWPSAAGTGRTEETVANVTARPTPEATARPTPTPDFATDGEDGEFDAGLESGFSCH